MKTNKSAVSPFCNAWNEKSACTPTVLLYNHFSILFIYLFVRPKSMAVRVVSICDKHFRTELWNVKSARDTRILYNVHVCFCIWNCYYLQGKLAKKKQRKSTKLEKCWWCYRFLKFARIHILKCTWIHTLFVRHERVNLFSQTIWNNGQREQKAFIVFSDIRIPTISTFIRCFENFVWPKYF